MRCRMECQLLFSRLLMHERKDIVGHFALIPPPPPGKTTVSPKRKKCGEKLGPRGGAGPSRSI